MPSRFRVFFRALLRNCRLWWSWELPEEFSPATRGFVLLQCSIPGVGPRYQEITENLPEFAFAQLQQFSFDAGATPVK
jgi:hypothetical protein